MLKRIGTLALLLVLLLSCASASALNDIRDVVDEPTPTATEPSETPSPAPSDAPVATPSPTVGDGVPQFKDLGADMGTGENMAQNISTKCRFQLSEGKAVPMVDGKLTTGWIAENAKSKILITLPENTSAGGLLIQWTRVTSSVLLVEYGRDGQEIARAANSAAYIGVTNYYPLNANTARVLLYFPQKEAAISELAVLSAGELPPAVQNWQPQPEKVDLLVVVAHPGEEFLFMGGTIPYYALARGKTVQVVYLSNGGRLWRTRYQEALNGLWNAGLRSYPEFVGYPDQPTNSLQNASRVWRTDIVRGKLVELIRKYKPEVIVTHDVNGENRQGANMLIASVIQESVTQAADSSLLPDLVNQYGVWQTAKLYLHLFNENQITMDYQTELPELGGISPSQAARQSYALHATQRAVPYQDGGAYDNSKYGLAYTMVGMDREKNDLFENVTGSAADWNPDLRLQDAQDPAPLPGDPQGIAAGETPSPGAGLPLSGDVPGALSVTPPPAAKNEGEAGANIRLIVLLAGIPVVLAAGAYGYAPCRKFIKKLRRAQRRAARYKNNG